MQQVEILPLSGVSLQKKWELRDNFLNLDPEILVRGYIVSCPGMFCNLLLKLSLVRSRGCEWAIHSDILALE
jgi:hypothetical protein